MKKNKTMYIALLLIPMIVVGIAVSPNSVVISDGENAYTTSFAVIIEDSNVGWCAPVAVILDYFVFAMAVIFGLHKKDFWLKGILGLSFTAMILTVTPVLAKGDLLIVPNVFVAILLGAECIGAYLLLHRPAEDKQDKKQGERLKAH